MVKKSKKIYILEFLSQDQLMSSWARLVADFRPQLRLQRHANKRALLENDASPFFVLLSHRIQEEEVEE